MRGKTRRIAQLASRFEVDIGDRFTIVAWKRALVEGAPELFAMRPFQKSQEKAKEAQINHLYRHIGQLKVERAAAIFRLVGKVRSPESQPGVR